MGESPIKSPGGALSRATMARELVTFALQGLPGMRLPDGTFCLEVHADEMRPRGRSIRYSIMAALGVLRAAAAGYDVPSELNGLADTALGAVDDPTLTVGDLGLMLWLDRRAGHDHAPALARELDQRLKALGGLGGIQGMEVAWIAIGAREAVSSGLTGPVERLLHSARAQLCLHNLSSSGLLLHRGSGARRRFPNFATQIYGILALSRLGAAGDDEAQAVARRVADAIIALQRPDGGWPWIFDTQRGRVVEPYEIYSVHQDAMAPMGLFELYGSTGEDRYRAAAARGVDWVYGSNDLGRPLLDAERHLLFRSIRRRRPWDRAMVYLSPITACAGMPLGTRWRGPLEINPTDRPYHLAWLLEAWCGREEMANGTAA